MSVFSENKDEAKRILFCSKCKQVFSGDPSQLEHCPDCDYPLYNTDYDVLKWRKLDEYEKGRLKLQWSNETGIPYDAEYEYDVVTLFDKEKSRVDRVKLNTILNEHAKAGWRLHTIYANEIYKNLTLGANDYKTISENIIIFERKIKK